MPVLDSMMSYASTGASIGGPWGAVAGAAVGLFAGLMDDNDQAAQMNKLVDAYIDQAKAKNKLNLQEAARNASEINRQRSLAYIQTAQSLQHMQAEGSTATAQVNVMQAVTDSIGNSSKIVKSDINHQMNDARAQIELNAETVQENLNVSLDTMINQAKSSFAAVSMNGVHSTGSGISSFGQGLVAAGAGLLQYRRAGGSLPWDSKPISAREQAYNNILGVG